MSFSRRFSTPGSIWKDEGRKGGGGSLVGRSSSLSRSSHSLGNPSLRDSPGPLPCLAALPKGSQALGPPLRESLPLLRPGCPSSGSGGGLQRAGPDLRLHPPPPPLRIPTSPGVGEGQVAPPPHRPGDSPDDVLPRARGGLFSLPRPRLPPGFGSPPRSGGLEGETLRRRSLPPGASPNPIQERLPCPPPGGRVASALLGQGPLLPEGHRPLRPSGSGGGRPSGLALPPVFSGRSLPLRSG